MPRFHNKAIFSAIHIGRVAVFMACVISRPCETCHTLKEGRDKSPNIAHLQPHQWTSVKAPDGQPQYLIGRMSLHLMLLPCLPPPATPSLCSLLNSRA